MADFNFRLNQQGPQGKQGPQGEKGEDGITPIFYEGTNTPTEYTLTIDYGNGNTSSTGNLRPPVTNNGGTYLRYENGYVLGTPDYADLNRNPGEVVLASVADVANEDAEDSDAVSMELRNSDLTAIDNRFDAVEGDVTTLQTDKADKSTTYTKMEVDNALAGKANTSHTHTVSQITNAGALASKDTVNYNTDVTNKPTLGTLAGKNTVDYVTEVTNKPTIPTPGNGTITVTQGGVIKGTFTTNQSGNSTIALDAGGTASFTAGTGINITNNTISVNNATLNTINSAVQPSDLGDLATKDTVNYNTDITNKPTLGSLASKSTVDYTTDITNKPTLGALSSKDTVDYTTEIINKPTLGSLASKNTVDYNTDITNKPTIPTDTSDLTNGAGYITSANLSNMVTTNTYQQITGSKDFNQIGFNVAVDANNRTALDLTGGVYKLGNAFNTLSLEGSGTRPLYNGTDYLALSSDIPNTSNFITTTGSTLVSNNKTIAFNDNQYKILSSNDTTHDVSFGDCPSLGSGTVTNIHGQSIGLMANQGNRRPQIGLGNNVWQDIVVDNDYATTAKAGLVKPDGSTITVASDGTISAVNTGSGDVTTTTNQIITGEKTFEGNKRIKFKQTTSEDKLGFTMYDNNDNEVAFFEWNGSTYSADLINGKQSLCLGNWYADNTVPKSQCYIGKIMHDGDAGSDYVLVSPLASDAQTPFGLTSSRTVFYDMLGVKINSYDTYAKTLSSGVLDIEDKLSDLPHLDTYSDLTLGATDAEYVSTHDGWILFDKLSTGNNQYANAYTTIPGYTTLDPNLRLAGSGPRPSGWNATLFFPVRKGQKFSISYNLGGTTNYFRFYPSVREVQQ